MYNNYLYVVGGTDASSSTTSTVYFSKLGAGGGLGSWSTSSQMLGSGSILGTVARTAASAVVANGYLYIAGGNDGSAQTNILYSQINAATGDVGSWTKNATDFPVSNDGASTFVGNGRLYIVGNGSSATAAYGTLNSGTGALSGITDITSSNGLQRAWYGQAGIALNGYLYVIGGQGSGGSSTVTSLYATFPGLNRLTVNAPLIDFTGGDNGATAWDVGAATAASSSLNAGNVRVGGQLDVTGMANFLQSVSVNGELVVGGNTTVRSSTNSATAFTVQNSGGTSALTVATNAASLAVATVTIGGSLQISGHIITGGGGLTVALVDSDMGTGGSCNTSIVGNDTAGRIIITAGTGASLGAGTLCTYSFSTPYGSTPHVLISPIDYALAQIDPYAKAISASSFEFGTGINLSPNTQYGFEYWVVQ